MSTVSILCMTCCDRLNVSDDDVDFAAKRVEAWAKESGWVCVERDIDGRKHTADVCETCAAIIRDLAPAKKTSPTTIAAVMAFHDVIVKEERLYNDALDKVRELANEHELDAIYTLTRKLDKALFVMSCLRRLIDGRSVREIHQAFGAPGDFGYETPIGSSLDKLYRTPSTEVAQ